MTHAPSALANLPDDQLLLKTKHLAARERRATADLIASLAEVDARRLYLGAGCSSLFTYCTQVLHLSEHAAYGRIVAARSVRAFPAILQSLDDGSINLTTVRLLAPHLTAENHSELLEAARHKSKRDVELLVARIHPLPPVTAAVRKLPAPRAPKLPIAAAPIREEAVKPPALCITPAPPSSRPSAVVAPLNAERYKIQFTASHETHDKLRRAQDLLRHSIPNGDPAAIFDRALTVLLENLERRKLGAAAGPRAARPLRRRGSRQLPAAVKREVWKRDGGQCAFVGTNGRCAETGFLEFHHVVPYAEGGPAIAENIELRCRPTTPTSRNGTSGRGCSCGSGRRDVPGIASSVRTKRPTEYIDGGES